MYGGLGGYGGYGGLGGMGMGMGGMYGGSGMYGGGMYGGGGLGMGSYGGSGMYGSGMGMNSYGGGMYGNNNNNGGFGNNGNSILGGNGNGGLLGNPQDSSGLQQQQGLLPSGDQPNSPIHQLGSPLPPLNETPEERARRLHAEHRRERQLVKQMREKRRQVRLQARMEVAGHLTNVLVQTLRSTMEMFAVCFGTYYSVKAVRAFSATQENSAGMRYQRGPMGQMIPVPGSAQPAVAAATADTAAAAKVSGGSGRWKSWLLFGALFIVGEVIYGIVTRARQPPRRLRSRAVHPVEDEYGNVYTQDERGLLSGSEELEDSMMSSDYADEFVDRYGASSMVNGGVDGSRGKLSNRRVCVALYDYEADPECGNYVSFKAGDEFIVDDYVEGSWCQARVLESSTHAPTPVHGLVPSNFLRVLEHTTKL